MKKIILIFLIISILLISGCTESEDNGGNIKKHSSNALSIIDFSSDPKTIESSQDIYLEATVKNTGAQRAENVKIRIYNPPFGSCTECWQVRNTNPSCPSLGELWSCLDDISQPDQLTGVEGQEKTAYWYIRAPQIESGSEIDYDFYSRLYYKYKSTATTQIELINRNEITSTSKGKPDITTTKGPVKFYVETESPIPITEGQDRIRFCVSAKNKGKGTLYAPGVPANDIRKEDFGLLNLEIEFGGLDQVVKDTLKLNQTYCTNFYPHEVNIKKTVPITIKGEYNYYEDEETTVTVKSY